ncbi:hypothetical protein V9T40_001159 [Parthenolecanium corni]|uniref:Uncharacterized protein n=1 Tax=Parthenolecanium corni TaxID=536013 RepID=A0AAN9TB49_9HEMI
MRAGAACLSITTRVSKSRRLFTRVPVEMEEIIIELPDLLTRCVQLLGTFVTQPSAFSSGSSSTNLYATVHQ